MIVVLDSNVLIAALAFGGICRDIVDACITDHRLVVSDHILAEVRQCLSGTFGLSAAEADAQLVFIREAAKVIEPASVDAGACRDRNDLPILGTMLAGKASCLVTGDKDLLVLKQFEDRPILSPRDFVDGLQRPARTNEQ